MRKGIIYKSKRNNVITCVQTAKELKIARVVCIIILRFKRTLAIEIQSGSGVKKVIRYENLDKKVITADRVNLNVLGGKWPQNNNLKT